MAKPCNWCTRETQETCPQCWGTGVVSPDGLKWLDKNLGNPEFVEAVNRAGIIISPPKKYWQETHYNRRAL